MNTACTCAGLVLACLVVGQTPAWAAPAERSAALDRAILADDAAAAWTLAESLADGPNPWASRGVAALTWLGRDLARCDEGGRLPALERLLERADAGPWLRWTAWNLLRTNLERCRSWEAVDAMVGRVIEVEGWLVDLSPVTTGIEDAFFRVRSWTPQQRGDRVPNVRWTLRTAGRLLASAELCVEDDGWYSILLESRAPGTLWIDEHLVLLAEPGSVTVRRTHRAATDLHLDGGCHKVKLGLAVPPGWGRARVRLLAAPAAEPDTRGSPDSDAGWVASGHGALLREAPHDAAAVLEAIDPEAPGTLLLRYRLEQFLDRRTPLEALVAQYAQPGQDDAALCLLWRHRLGDTLLSGGTEARPWLELWPPACRDAPAGRLLEARHEVDTGRSTEAAERSAAVADTLEEAGLWSCMALTTRTSQRVQFGEAVPLLLDATPFCRQEAFADAAARGTGEDAARAAALQERLMVPDEGFPGALQLARRLHATMKREPARQLLTRLGWSDPDLLWTRADMDDPEASGRWLTLASDSPMATTDLRAREGMLQSWSDLDTLAASVDPIVEAYRRSDWGSGPMVVVLDETILRLRAHGRITERSTRVVHLRNQQAAQDWTDFQVPDSGQVIGLRVYKTDGTWREPDALGAGDLANLGELGQDDIVILETIDELDPLFALEDQVCLPTFYFSSRDTPVWRSRLVLLNETELPLEVTQFWGAPAAEMVNPRTQVFEARRLETAVEEDGLPQWDTGLPRAEICSAGMSWPRLRDQLADGLMRLVTPDPSIRRLAKELANQEDPVRAAFEEVQGRVAVDNSRLFTQRAPEILAEREGAATILLLALLIEMDVPATLVLVDPPGGAAGLPGLADPAVHSEPVLRVTRGERSLWLDPFGPAARFGALRPYLGNRPGLIMEAGGPLLRVSTPRVDPTDHAIQVEWDIRIEPDGGADADLTIRFSGIAGANLWERFRSATQDRRDEAVASYTQGFFQAAVPRIQAMHFDGDTLVFKVSVGFPAGAFNEPTLLRLGSGTLQRRYASRSRRVLPILLEGEALTQAEIHLSAPRGHRLTVEGSRGSIMTDFGLHETIWTSGRKLSIRHTRHMSDRLLPASRYGEVVSFARAADAMDQLVLRLESVR